MFYDLVVMDQVHILRRTKRVRQQRGEECNSKLSIRITSKKYMQNKIISDTAK